MDTNMTFGNSNAINSGGSNENDRLSQEDDDSDWYESEELLESDEEEISNIDNDSVFGFETDHAALKGNADYHELIKTLAILEAQRVRTIKDIEMLEKMRIKVKTNPKEYLRQFLSGDYSEIPSDLNVQQVPVIDWSKYHSLGSKRGIASLNKAGPASGAEELGSASPQEADWGEDGFGSMVVRGRPFDQTKPQTFNQLWTPEEQLRLEELLTEFPPERNENNRWRKIAQALGNRTTKQVCSRVQKYFKKLTKAGLPIPGHQLKTSNMTSSKKKPRRQKKCEIRTSTFFPTQHLGAPKLLDGCEEEDNKAKLPELTAELKANIIRKVIEFKCRDEKLPPFSHPGIICSVCGETPLRGTRWRCLLCHSVNLCSDCVINQLNVEDDVHPPSHPLEPLTNPTVVHWDPDYTPDSFQSTNYLDPNFITSNIL